MELTLIAPTIILLVAMITDIKDHKIYNKWIALSIIIALANNYYFFGFDGIRNGAVAAVVVLLMTLPLILLGLVGVAEMKLLFAFGLTSTYTDIFTITVFSFIWVAIAAITRRFYKTPYSAAIFAAWLTYVFLGYRQGHF